MPGCIVSATTASFRSVENRRRRATPVMTSTFENVSDIGVCLGLCLGPPAKAGVRSKRGAVHATLLSLSTKAGLGTATARQPGLFDSWSPLCVDAAPAALCGRIIWIIWAHQNYFGQHNSAHAA